jgi:SAM-dependent methyltransferase
MSFDGALEQMRGPEWISALDALCRQHITRDMTVVELGSFAGESTAVFAGHAARVIAIDPWAESYETQVLEGCSEGPVRDHVARVGLAPMSRVEMLFDRRIASLTNVTKMKAFDHQVVEAFPDGSVDFIYLDSIHTFEYVSDSLSRWIHKLRPGGVFAGHDYSMDTWPGVVRAVDTCFGSPDSTYGDTSWVVTDEAKIDRLRRVARSSCVH